MNAVKSYVAGFNYRIGDLGVSMSIVPFTIGDKLYESIRYKNIYVMALVRFSLVYSEKKVVVCIPFYESSGANSSQVGSGTWFPFHCVSQKLENSTREYYFRSSYGDQYLFKMGHYFAEPFSGKCDDSPKAGIRDIIPVPANSSCIRQRNFIIEQTSEIPVEVLHPEIDKGVGVHTVIQRFGNLLYLTASYFLLGDHDNWNPSKFLNGSREQAFASVLTRISYRGVFGNSNWHDIASRLPRTNWNRYSIYTANDSGLLNYILMANQVPMPHYQDVLRMDNGIDAKFVTYMKLLQMIGELYLESQMIELWNRFSSTFNRAFLINSILLTTQDNLRIENDYHTWLVPEIFSGNDILVRLYRFV